AITFWDVLEHTHSPQKVLRQANALLEDNGLLAINVPNWASWERRIFKERWIALDTPRHLYHFSPNILRAYLRICGFEVISLRTKAPVMSPASNVLRAIGDTALRGGQAKSQISGKNGGETAVTPPPSLIKQTLIRLTYAALTLPNILANVANRGGSIIVFARKTEIVP
ncbi:MAG TPA: class I SAM-dependent methyltransferase, partial [Anaerolineae bacterium]|nr:class I SAM-dependent methyltransferase [Anaerolineae bacterium]